MAETVHLTMKGKKQGDIKGESSQTTLGRENTIECVYYEHSVVTARESGSSLSTGRRQHNPILIRKRIDSSSPLLMNALCMNEEISEATFKFYRPNPKGDGTTEQFYTVKLTGARVASVKQYSPDSLVPAESTEPPLEEVSFVFHTIEWNNTTGKTVAKDEWKGGE